MIKIQPVLGEPVYDSPLTNKKIGGERGTHCQSAVCGQNILHMSVASLLWLVLFVRLTLGRENRQILDLPFQMDLDRLTVYCYHLQSMM